MNSIIALFCLLLSSPMRNLALQLNLTAECSETHVYFCTLSNLTISYDDPLIVVPSLAPQLSELVLRNAIVTRLPKELFPQAPNLRGFFMHQCGLNRIQMEDFEQALRLQKLLLQQNRLSELPEKIFSAANGLRELYLANNHIHMVHARAFEALAQLRYLDLQQNSLHELPTGLFRELQLLEHIDMSSNDIEKIDSETFAHNLKLHTVLLSDNKFALFESNSLAHLPRLHLLDLSHCALDELQLQSVDTLLVQSSNLRRCEIQKSVIKLRANNNRLQTLDIGDKAAVKELELHGNMLDTLEPLVGMMNLQKLDVSKNELKSLRTSQSPLYLPLPSLVSLNLGFNQLQNLSADHFLLLLKLTHLDLAFNHLAHLDQCVLEPLRNLEKLYVEGNRLQRWDYEQLARTHPQLREMGVFSNDWDFPYMRAMVSFMKERNIQLPVRFNPNDALESHSTTPHHSAKLSMAASANHHHYATTEMSVELRTAADMSYGRDPQGVGGIHPYWTTRDVLALITLLVVLLILLLQFYRILQEENCFAACSRAVRNRATTVGGTQTRPRRLDEDDSEV